MEGVEWRIVLASHSPLNSVGVYLGKSLGQIGAGPLLSGGQNALWGLRLGALWVVFSISGEEREHLSFPWYRAERR